MTKNLAIIEGTSQMTKRMATGLRRCLVDNVTKVFTKTICTTEKVYLGSSAEHTTRVTTTKMSDMVKAC